MQVDVCDVENGGQWTDDDFRLVANSDDNRPDADNRITWSPLLERTRLGPSQIHEFTMPNNNRLTVRV